MSFGAHLCGWWLGYNHTTSQLQTYWVNIIVKPFHLYQYGGQLGVLIFFLISGFVVTHVSVNENLKEFIIKRFFRVMPTLVIALIVLALVVVFSKSYGIVSSFGNQSNDIKDSIYTLLLINRPLGTLDVLFETWTYCISFMVNRLVEARF